MAGPSTAQGMILHWSPRSPFVRKVMIAAHELGLIDRIERRRSVVSMTAPNPALLSDNPLSKIPTLLLADGTVIADSSVICEYFDWLCGGSRLIPAAGPWRWTELTWHAFADGLLETLVLWRNERDKPESAQTQGWIEGFGIKTIQTLGYFEREIERIETGRFGIAQITLGCCLSYLDFRFQFLTWRQDYSRLADWHDRFRARPSVQATEVVDDA